MKITRSGDVLRLVPLQWLDPGDIDSGLVPFRDLNPAGCLDKRFGGDPHPQPVEGFLRDKEIGDSRFVFQRNEAVAFCQQPAVRASDKGLLGFLTSGTVAAYWRRSAFHFEFQTQNPEAQQIGSSSGG